MFRLTVYLILFILYALAAGITELYFLGLLQRCDWQKQRYFLVLGRENLRWLPLIFSMVPAAAWIMDYGNAAYGLCAGYCLAAALFYWPWPGRESIDWTGSTRRLYILWICLWLLLLLPFLLIPAARSDALIVFLCILFLALPFVPLLLMLFDRPLARLVGRHFIRGSEGILSLHDELKIIAVTGSGDAPVLMEALNRILQTQYRCERASRTVRTAIDAAQIIRDMEDPTLEYLICRIDAGSMEEMKAILESLHPEITIQSSADYFVLVESENAGESRGIRFVNGDDAVLRQFIGTERVLTYGLKDGNDTVGSIDRQDAEGTAFRVHGSELMQIEFRTRLLGRPNITELLGAICVAYSLGIPEDKMQRQIRTLPPISHRLELTALPGVLRIDDSGNDEELGGEEALETLRRFDGTRILITDGFLRLGVIQEEANRRFGAAAAEVCDHIFLVGDEVAYGLRIGILEAGFRPEHLHETSSSAEARRLIDALEPGHQKVVLVEYREAPAAGTQHPTAE